MERAARMSGARFGTGWEHRSARARALPIRARSPRSERLCHRSPASARCASRLVGTGALPSDEANVYELPTDGLYLAGTAEILSQACTPARSSSGTSCRLRRVLAVLSVARRVAGRDTRGMIRVHQFNKVEQFSLTRPEESGRARSSCSPTRRSSSASSVCRTASSSYRPATCRARRRRRTTWRSGSRARGATGRPHRSRTPPTSRRGGSGSVHWRERPRAAAHAERHGSRRPHGARDPREPPGGRPDVLQGYGGPSRIGG